MIQKSTFIPVKYKIIDVVSETRCLDNGYIFLSSNIHLDFWANIGQYNRFMIGNDNRFVVGNHNFVIGIHSMNSVG